MIRPLFPLLAAVGVTACDGGTAEFDSVLDCGTADQDPTYCCPIETYEPLDPAALRLQPGSLVGRQLALRGPADTFLAPSATEPCECVGEVCGCVTDLALRTLGCDDIQAITPLGGVYGGRTVSCGDSGCWPLSLGINYAVCGTFTYDQNGTSQGSSIHRPYYLAVESFCSAE